MSYRNRKKNYPLYDTVTFSDIREMMENCRRDYGDRTAFIRKLNPKDTKVQSMTFAECHSYVRALATEFSARGLGGKRAAIISRGSPEWVLTFFALMCCGAVAVPVDAELPADEICGLIKDAECEAVFMSASVSAKISKTALPECVRLFAKIGYYPKDAVSPEGSVSLASLRADGEEKYTYGDRSYYETEIDREGLAAIFYTSGTTGKGKGVMLSQTNIVSDMTQGMYLFDITRKTLCVLPPHHTYCSTVNFVGHFAQGCEVYMSSGLKYIQKELREESPTHLVLVPLFVETFYKKILSTIRKEGKEKTFKTGLRLSKALRAVGIDRRRQIFKSIHDFFGGKLQMIICGGAALNQDIIDFFDAIGVIVLNGYGISECAPLICYTPITEGPKMYSCGRPLPGIMEVKILDPNEEGIGEVVVRGENTMTGYYKNPQATKEAFTKDGWLRTGDLGQVDQDGFLYIKGRCKTMLLGPSGQNIYPEEIEAKINNMPYVLESLVLQQEDTRLVALICPDYNEVDADGLTAEQLEEQMEDARKQVNSELAAYEQISIVKLYPHEFEKTPKKSIKRFLYTNMV